MLEILLNKALNIQVIVDRCSVASPYFAAFFLWIIWAGVNAKGFFLLLNLIALRAFFTFTPQCTC